MHYIVLLLPVSRHQPIIHHNYAERKEKGINKILGKNEDLTLQQLFKLKNGRGGVDSQDLT